MEKTLIINISILIILFIGNIIISDYNNYFILIYLCLCLYNIYTFFYAIKNKTKSHICKTFFFFFISILLYPLTYLIICDPNPFFCFIVYYIFYPNFLKAILIVLIHTYFIHKFLISQKSDKIIINKNNLLKRNFFKKKNKSVISNFYFLSDFFIFFKKKKILFFVFICCLFILIRYEVHLFINRTKIWVSRNSKEKTLPIASSKNTTFFITATIVNMESIMNKYLEEMKKLINYLGDNNVIVSIVENGDSKDKTRDHLKEFQKYLNEKKIINRFLLEHEIDDPRKKQFPFVFLSYLRIQFYALLRNRCLDFLYELPNIDFDNTKIIFFNDVIFEYEDIINLLATNNEDYDAACGMDFYDFFYDTWVALDLDGYSLKYRFPFFVNKEAQDLVTNHKPVRVLSCWNGVIAFTAAPLKDKKLQFRYRNEDNPRKNEIHNSEHYNYESECTYFHIDLFSLGYTKKFVNPDVRFAYKFEDYTKRKNYTLRKIEIDSYIELYSDNFFRKRNKYMSNYKDKNITFNQDVENWYLENKRKDL